ncbi:MAG TPA: hypothetical protein VFL53_12310 [Pseudolabrys sp.]|jgi:hypothetical protein|nr:hypothetical protein [Pseudolabrys sp.]
MRLRRALPVVCVIALFAGGAKAQFGPAPQQQEPPCIKDFSKLREDTEKKAAAIKAASDRKASPREACQLFNAFVASQSKMLKYATDNATWCGIPGQIMVNLKEGITKTSEVRNRVCQAAAAPPRPTGPSLSDALSGPVPDSNNIRTGRGTFDTLTGNPLGR